MYGLKVALIFISFLLFGIGMVLGLVDHLTPHANAICLFGGLASYTLAWATDRLWPHPHP